MFTYENISRIAIVIWSLTWLPGIVLFVFRVTHLWQSGRRTRAAIEGPLLVSIPVAAWGLYVWSDTMMQLAAGIPHVSAGTPTYLVQTAVPYLVSVISIFGLHLIMGAIDIRSTRLVAIILGLIAAPIAAPRPFLSLLMVLAGG